MWMGSYYLNELLTFFCIYYSMYKKYKKSKDNMGSNLSYICVLHINGKQISNVML